MIENLNKFCNGIFLFLIAGMCHTATAQSPQLKNFAMIWNFCDQNGQNQTGHQDVCLGDRVYLINKSRYGATPSGDNGQWPINSLLVSGEYKFTSPTGTQIYAPIPAANWHYGQVISFVVGSNIQLHPSNGGALNFTVSYFPTSTSSGATVAPGGRWWRERSLYLHRLPDPDYYLFATPNAICPGGTSSLYISNNSNHTFEWSTGQTSAAITVNPVGVTTYTVTVTRSNGCSLAKNVTVTIESDQITVNPAYYICGTTRPTICPPEGNATTSWYNKVNGQSNLEHTGSCFTPSQAGSYTVVQNSPCFVQKDFEVLDVGGQLVPNFNLSTNDQGNHYTITANATQNPYPSNVPNVSHYWSVEDVTQGCIANNPSIWWGAAYPSTATAFTNNFPEFAAAGCNLSTTYNQGQFLYGHTYIIVRGIWSDCDGWTAYSATLSTAPSPISELPWGKKIVYAPVVNTAAFPDYTHAGKAESNTLNSNFTPNWKTSDNLSFDVYPNPTKGQFDVIVETDTEATLQVVDLIGRVVLTKIVTENRTTLDISKQASGVYFITLTSGALTKTKRVVKNK